MDLDSDDPQVFLQYCNRFTFATLGVFLGDNGLNFPEMVEHRQRQGLRFLKHCGVIPERDTPATCPECGQRLRTNADKERYGWRYVCRNHATKKRFSPLDNTFLQMARLRGELSSEKVVELMFLWLYKETLVTTQEQVQVSQDTAMFWYGHCREVACAIAWHDYGRIGGAGDVVEVGETRLFRRRKKVGRVSTWEHTWAVGAISRTTKKRFVFIVEERDEETLVPILSQCIDHDSYICTGTSQAYGDCGVIFNGHGMVAKVRTPREQEPLWMPAGTFNEECLEDWNGPPPVPGQQPFRNHTKNVERMLKDLKSFVKTTNGPAYGSQYLGEYMYRKNILEEYEGRKEQFLRFLRDVRRVYPGIGKKPMKKTYEEIVVGSCDCHECEP